MSFLAIIPARFASTRLPGKMLIDIAGKPMVLHVVERARESAASDVIVATDHVDIEAALGAHGVRTLLTAAAHASGTDRLAEVVSRLDLADEEIVVNIQGDEPLIDPMLINAVAEELLGNPQANMATAARQIASAADFFNPNFVKVVCDASGMALYFSRAPIPFVRDTFAGTMHSLPQRFPALHHIGIYAYRVGFLKRFCNLPQSPAEKLEALEQLRALHHGYRIAVKIWERPVEAGVDTTEDLERVRSKFR